MLRDALSRLDRLLQTQVSQARLTSTFGLYFGPLVSVVILAAIGVGGLGLLMVLVGIGWGWNLMTLAGAAVSVFVFFGILAIATLSVADVGLSAAVLARDAVREARHVRRQRAHPEAGQLMFGEVESAAGALTCAEDEAGRVSVAEPIADPRNSGSQWSSPSSSSRGQW